MNNSIRATETNSLNLARLIAGMLIGSLVGFCMVILITPHSGEMTRNKIERQSILAQKRAIDIYSELLLLSQFDKRKILSGTRKEYQSQ
jgi:gas vesicle protein